MSIPMEETVSKRRSALDLEKEAKKYVLYTRNETGIIERKGFATFLYYWSQVPHMHEEVLIGWPEQNVFWANDEGASIGIAPMIL